MGKGSMAGEESDEDQDEEEEDDDYDEEEKEHEQEGGIISTYNDYEIDGEEEVHDDEDETYDDDDDTDDDDNSQAPRSLHILRSEGVASWRPLGAIAGPPGGHLGGV